jgi:membrane protease YdiL (CAAX protease family)
VANSTPELQRPAPVPPRSGYFAWSQDPAVGLFAVLPLWLAYESLRLLLTPEERNGAEVLVHEAIGMLGRQGVLVLRLLLGVLVYAAMRSVVRRRIPWARVVLVLALEGMVYGLLLGPLAGALAMPAARWLALMPPDRLVADLVGSLGAGIFEELVFRLGLMSLLAWLWLKAARAFSLPPALGGVLAVAVSAVVFAAFHHLWGEPYDRATFLFRTMAGVILGLLMWFRGYGVCVYAHAMYDVYYFLSLRGP